MLWEAMVDDMRATQADLAARSVFAADGERITDTRSRLAEAIAGARNTNKFEPDRLAHSAGRLKAAADNGFVEVG